MSRAIDAVQALNNINWHHRPTPVNQFDSGFNQGLNQAMWEITHAPTLTQPNEWVSVEERLPEPDFPGQQRGFYLVALSNGTVKELMYEFRHYENMMFDVGWHETAFPVTHWMPLPDPPNKINTGFIKKTQ